jgi:hypothetical protein
MERQLSWKSTECLCLEVNCNGHDDDDDDDDDDTVISECLCNKSRQRLGRDRTG